MRRSYLPLALGLSLALAACGGGSSSSSGLTVRTTSHAVLPSSPLTVRGSWLVYLASEGMTGNLGTILNGDGDTLDNVAVALRLNRAEAFALTAAFASAVLGNEIYLAVSEAEDGVDWDGVGGAVDFVLLHWSLAAGMVTYVDTLDISSVSDLAFLQSDARLYYSSTGAPVGVDDTSLRYVAQANPTTPVVVENAMGGGSLDPELGSLTAGLLVLALDEVEEGAILNGDGDMLDGSVLALLDTTDAAARVVNVGLAMADESDPVDAFFRGSNDWLVGFLVDEASQGVNLNAAVDFVNPLQPASCLTADADMLDQVLHYLDFETFAAGMSAAVSTGLAGHDRVVVVDGYLATLADEADAACDMNEDGDTSDEIVRWVAASAPVQPPVNVDALLAAATNVPGGARGLSNLGRRFVIVVDESDDGRNHDGKAQDHELAAWLDPAAAGVPAWQFAHQSGSTPSFGTGIFDSMSMSEPYAGVSWLAADPQGSRLSMTFLEEVPGTNPNISSLNNNENCSPVMKDADLIDALPVWTDFESGPTLDFDGVGFAVDSDNAGLVLAGGFAFFRVDEAADNRDYNNDGNRDDMVLMRNPILSCDPVPMATSSANFGPVVVTDGFAGAAFLSSEAMAGIDLNGDGDMLDVVVRYFTF